MRRSPTRGRRRRGGAIAASVALAAAVMALVLPLSGAALPQAAPSNTSPPTITGSVVKGQTLVAGTGTWDGTTPISFTFSWQRCDSAGANCAAISDATNTTYVLVSADVGSRMRVLVTASNAEGTSSALSEATGVVADEGTAPKNTAEPAISGTITEGQTVTATSGTWTGAQPISFSYQWVHCPSDGGAPDGSNCANISGATGSSYVLVSSDVGWRIRVRVTGTNSVGSTTVASNPTGPVAPKSGAPKNTAEPRISGTPTQGQRLTANPGTWTGTQPITIKYQWVRCPSDGGAPDGSNCATISGATGSSYVLVSSDVGWRIRVRVTGTNSAGSTTVASNPTQPVAAPKGKPVNTRAPSISGSMVEGSLLTANPGTWTGTAPITYTYQWLRCNSTGGACGSISGATRSQYRLTSSDVGRKVRVRVTAKNSAGSTTATSGEYAVVASAGAAGVITLPSGEKSIPVTSVPKTERLVVDTVKFTPNPVRSRTAPISVQIRIKDTRGYVVRDALVFIRSTPLVTKANTRKPTLTDGYVVYQMIPRQSGNPFPKPRNGYNVQFFIKAYRAGDPPLAGVAGYRLVQVRLANP